MTNPYRPDTPSEDELKTWKDEAESSGQDPDTVIDEKIEKQYQEKLRDVLPDQGR